MRNRIFPWVTALAAFSASGCRMDPFGGMFGAVVGHGPVETRVVGLSAFHRVQVGGGMRVTIEAGNPQVTVKAQQSLLKFIEVRQKGDEVIIRTARSISSSHPIEVQIAGGPYQSVDVSGATRGTASGFDPASADIDCSGASDLSIRCSSDTVRIDASGASSLHWTEARAAKIDVTLAGASKLIASGTASDAVLDASGASTFDLTGLSIEQCEVSASGASTAKVDVMRALKAVATGASTIRYRGKPAMDLSSNGASTVSPL